jgi:thiol-disulfide isomerase/thioredoxin
MEMAKSANKNIFIDTYADWCIPCKKMDKELSEPTISNFFNDNYINVKINIETSPNASEYRKAYDIVFLPTVLILDPSGNIKYKTDKFISGKELKGIAEKTMEKNVYFVSDATDVIRDPMSSNINKSGPAVIVHKLGSPNQNPEFLMKEAYFRIELMDLSHRKAASKYLETQSDWSTKKNMRFILDFLYDTKSPEFVYFSQHIDNFREAFGKEEVNSTLQILINEEMERGFPRPDLESAQKLNSLINPATAEQKAHLFLMDRYYLECNTDLYKTTVKSYLEKFDQTNPRLYFSLGKLCTESDQKLNSSDIEDCISSTLTAIQLEDATPSYYEQLTNLYLLKNDKKEAIRSIKKAIEVAYTSNVDPKPYELLEQKLKGEN